MVTIIVKGTNACNLACSYCSLGKKENFRFADEDMLKWIFRYSCNYAREKREQNINFILHGGEPTLIQEEVYQDAIDSVKTENRDLNISLSMQSNGVTITDGFIKFALLNDIHMGISIDGSAEIHDSERRTSSGEGTYWRVIQNIERMQRAGLGVSCLMVLTKNAIGKGFDYLKYFGQRQIHLKINPLLNYGEVYEHPELCLEAGDYARYLIGLYQYLIDEDVSVTVSPIDDILQAILNQHRLGECSFNPNCNKHFLCIDFSGDIYPCGKFSDMGEFKLGNVDQGIVKDDILQKLSDRRNRKKPPVCGQCRYLDLCNCGCSAEALIDGYFYGAPILCEDYKMLFHYFSSDGLVLLRKELLRQKRILEDRR